MAITGRPPIPANMHKIKGSFRKDRHGNFSDIGMACPSPPEDLPDRARKEWVRVAAVLSKYKLLSEMDLQALELYCRVYARWRDAEDQLQNIDSLVFETQTGYQTQSAYLNIANQCIKQMSRMLVEFGMTPSARERLRSLENAQGNEDPFDDFLKRKAGTGR